MDLNTVILTAGTSSVAVTLVLSMVPNAIDSRPVNDDTIEKGYYVALTGSVILGTLVSVMARSILPLAGAAICAVLVIAAHNTIQHNGMATV